MNLEYKTLLAKKQELKFVSLLEVSQFHSFQFHNNEFLTERVEYLESYDVPSMF